MKKKSIVPSIITVIVLIFILIGIFYGFQQHILLFNSCYFSGATLAVNNSGPFCLSNNGVNIIINNSILSYYPNSTLAINNQNVSALPFSFMDNHPLLTIWNEPSYLGPDSYSFLTIPDTFEIHMVYNASADTNFIIMTNQQYVEWVNTKDIKNDYVLMQTGSNISVWFNQSAGCAGYIAIIESVSGSAISISPDEQALYDPASQPTGVCAG